MVRLAEALAKHLASVQFRTGTVRTVYPHSDERAIYEREVALVRRNYLAHHEEVPAEVTKAFREDWTLSYCAFVCACSYHCLALPRVRATEEDLAILAQFRASNKDACEAYHNINLFHLLPEDLDSGTPDHSIYAAWPAYLRRALAFVAVMDDMTVTYENNGFFNSQINWRRAFAHA